MSGLFGGKSREERRSEQQQRQVQIHGQQAAAADRYDDMVTKALERLTRWAFPDSQVERTEVAMWELWHMADEGDRYVDVSVTLEFDEDQPEGFLCDSLHTEWAMLTREELDDALRMCISALR